MSTCRTVHPADLLTRPPFIVEHMFDHLSGDYPEAPGHGLVAGDVSDQDV
jgi:hypothetical protein